jgi:hypothetical protein
VRPPGAARVVLAAKRLVDDVAALAEAREAAYCAGLADGIRSGSHDGYGDGYRDGFDAGVDIGGARVLLALEHAIGRDRLDQLVRDADNRVPHTATWLDYRQRTTYTGPGDTQRRTA